MGALTSTVRSGGRSELYPSLMESQHLHLRYEAHTHSTCGPKLVPRRIRNRVETLVWCNRHDRFERVMRDGAVCSVTITMRRRAAYADCYSDNTALRICGPVVVFDVHAAHLARADVRITLSAASPSAGPCRGRFVKAPAYVVLCRRPLVTTREIKAYSRSCRLFVSNCQTPNGSSVVAIGQQLWGVRVDG